nr:PREDICTED: frataxin homolog, mitochondrial [Linepithema humile]
MLTVVTKFGVISRLSRNELSKAAAKQIVLLNRNYIRGYINCNSTRFLKKNRHTLLQLSVQNLNSNIGLSYSTDNNELSSVQYEKVCNETLESLTEYFEELIEAAAHLSDGDVSYGDGVLTIKFGDPHGTYVINRQTPNKQIWLSSPKSGPKRYDFINGQWVYKHDGKTLHELLNNEIPAIVKNQACFDKCSFSGKEKEAVIDNFSVEKYK